MKSRECREKQVHVWDPQCCGHVNAQAELDREYETEQFPLSRTGPLDPRPLTGAEAHFGPEKKEHDPVNSPAHYTDGEIECIDAIRSALGPDGFRAFCQGNVLKYTWRAQHKGREEDFKKLIWYARMAIGDDPRKDEK